MAAPPIGFPAPVQNPTVDDLPPLPAISTPTSTMKVTPSAPVLDPEPVLRVGSPVGDTTRFPANEVAADVENVQRRLVARGWLSLDQMTGKWNETCQNALLAWENDMISRGALDPVAVTHRIEPKNAEMAVLERARINNWRAPDNIKIDPPLNDESAATGTKTMKGAKPRPPDQPTWLSATAAGLAAPLAGPAAHFRSGNPWGATLRTVTVVPEIAFRFVGRPLQSPFIYSWKQMTSSETSIGAKILGFFGSLFSAIPALIGTFARTLGAVCALTVTRLGVFLDRLGHEFFSSELDLAKFEEFSMIAEMKEGKAREDAAWKWKTYDDTDKEWAIHQEQRAQPAGILLDKDPRPPPSVNQV